MDEQKLENQRQSNINNKMDKKDKVDKTKIKHKPLINELIRTGYINEEDEQGEIRLPGWYSIRFRMDGSTYTPCDTVFWRHFDNLQQYNPNVSEKIKDDSHFVKKLTPNKNSK